MNKQEFKLKYGGRYTGNEQLEWIKDLDQLLSPPSVEFIELKTKFFQENVSATNRGGKDLFMTEINKEPYDLWQWIVDHIPISQQASGGVSDEEIIECALRSDEFRTFQGTPCFGQERIAFNSGVMVAIRIMRSKLNSGEGKGVI